MQKRRLISRLKNRKIQFAVNLITLSWINGGINYAYLPALDLVGYGNNFKEAQNSLSVVVFEFIRYCENRKTIYNELERLGWSVKRQEGKVIPPGDKELLQSNKLIKECLRFPAVTSSTTMVNYN